MVVRGTTRGRLLRREQGGDARPPRIGQVTGGLAEDLDRERPWRVGLLAGAPRRMAAPGDRLVPAAKGGPGQAEAEAVGGLGEGQQQAADFRRRQRDQAGRPPFCSALAWRRVTSR